MVVDTEVHVFHRCFPIESVPGNVLERFRWHAFDGDLLIAEMDNAGVDRAFVISYDDYDVVRYMRSEHSEPGASTVGVAIRCRTFGNTPTCRRPPTSERLH